MTRELVFDKGINVIFGPNHSGKTTIVNSIRYGLFGLSLCHIPEGVEIKYFSSRINEKQRKSLDISVVYAIKSMTTTVQRIVYSSGSPTIEAFSLDSNTSLGPSKEAFDHEKEYGNYLTSMIGINPNNLPLISDLLFSDESRQTFLWSDNIDKFVLDLLTSKENSERLMTAEQNLKAAREQAKRLEDTKKRLLIESSEKQVLAESLGEELVSLQQSDEGKLIEEHDRLLLDVQDYRSKIANGTDSLEKLVNQKLSLIRQLEANDKKIEFLVQTKNRFKEDAIKAFLNSGDPDQYNLARCIYHDKKCPMCYSDQSYNISSRLDEQKCPLCGEGQLPADATKIDDIQSKIAEVELQLKQMADEKETLDKNIDDAENQIQQLAEKIRTYRNLETSTLQRINQLNSVEEQSLKKQLLDRQLASIESAIEDNLKKLGQTQSEIESGSSKVEGLEALYEQALQVCQKEIGNALTDLRLKFANFMSTATNGEVNATLSQNLVPLLEGRPVYNPFIASQSERMLMDYAFRIALLSTCAEKNNLTPSIILETPDEVIDESFIAPLANAIASFASNLSIIVTTFNSEMVDCLLKNYDIKGKDGRRLTNLLPTEGSLTQKKHYQPKLLKYSSEN